MKTKTEFFERMDDLIFENRNQEYGAYTIRKSYPDHVNKAFLIALSMATLLAMLPLITSLWRDSHVGIVIPGIMPHTLIETSVPRIEVLPKKNIQIAHPASQNVVPTHVTTDEVVPPEHIDMTATTTTIAEPGDTPGDVFPSDGNVGTPGTASEGTTTYVPPILSGIMAEYVGGPQAMARFLMKNLKYPYSARNMSVEGTVYVSFIVNIDGKVIRAEILKGISKECDEEAKRVVSLMPGWIAANQNGMPVMVRMVLPIKFSLGYN